MLDCGLKGPKHVAFIDNMITYLLFMFICQCVFNCVVSKSDDSASIN